MEARESELAQRLVFQPVEVGHKQQEWKEYNGFDCFGYVDLNQALMCDPWKLPQEMRFAYAASHVWSPEVRDVIIELLGEDHLKLWVNGQMVVERYNEAFIWIIPSKGQAPGGMEPTFINLLMPLTQHR